MPLTRREVNPVKLAQIGHVTSDPTVPATHNLEETTYISLVGLMKQIGDIATYADEIFTNLYNIAKETCERSNRLHKKISNLNECLNTGDTPEIFSYGPEPFTKTQKLFVNMSRPKAILDKYREAEPMPPLTELAEFVVDDRETYPHKLYSDPALFINAWLELMEREAQEMRRHRKRSFKKKADGKPKMATLKKKVHDPKTKGFAIIDVTLPAQYETLSVTSTGSPEPHSATLNRKKYARRRSQHADDTRSLTSSTSTNPGYATLPALSPDSVSSSHLDQSARGGAGSYSAPRIRQCSTPIADQPDIEITSPTEIELGIPEPLPPPPDSPAIGVSHDQLPSPPNSPSYDMPPPMEPPSPPAPLAPPLHDDPQYDFIRPASVSAKQRILRTNIVPETRGRDTLLEMIRSSSFSLRPVELKAAVHEEEQTYATYQGTDVASILQRRKYLMGAEEYGSDSSSDSEWD